MLAEHCWTGIAPILSPTTQAQLGLWKGGFALRPAFFRGAKNEIALSRAVAYQM